MKNVVAITKKLGYLYIYTEEEEGKTFFIMELVHLTLIAACLQAFYSIITND